MRFSESTILVSFNAAESDIFEFLDNNDMHGTKVSCVVNRWAVEVIYGKEKEAIEILENSPIVSYVYRDFIKGQPIYAFHKKRQDSPNKTSFGRFG